ncbi:Surfactin synthase thioesterase subunit [Jatrophihabitans endophyticus]|uniref:Surfactin synthase thioesterase subunit n=1 Tax=Jatrophihabitans endophyticus TaxID=1206085 RepID=A0A1M5CP79_9ACTN|nr:alpha/beta fold hydrolase [Jatrophihabitans endophyticus]SHF56511.1 Surfactin synthase thioesterase subunit [Jatrophihabitans endophyticus]
MSASEWFLAGRPAPSQVFCFPYAAGGAAVFFPYIAELAPDVQVVSLRLPGRESRLDEPPAFRVADVVDQVAAHVATAAVPYALLGHSMGAQLALEVAIGLAGRGASTPAALLVLGCPPPSDPPTGGFGDVETMSDADVVQFLRSVGGIPDQALAEPVLLELMLPAIRADLTWVARHHRAAAPLLDCPVVAVAGSADDHARPETMRRWSAYTRGPFREHVLPGGHFFVHDQVAAVADLVRAVLD